MNKMHTFLAKSNGKNLIEHTNEVVNNIKILTTKFDVDEVNTEILTLSAILHDIGKIRNKTQTFFKKGIEDKSKYKFAHNIIGWYFISKYVNHKDKSTIANLVLWHHANYNSCENLPKEIFNIQKEITDDELNAMKDICRHYDIDIVNEDDYIDPEYKTQFNEVDNLYRGILITSDVCASSDESVDEIFTKQSMELSNVDPDFIGSDRTKKQLDIINNIEDDNTTLIKAPTGFGKSIIGVLWAMPRDKQVIWVCPTNVISESIYDDIIDNLKLLKVHVNIELYITGERKKANNDLKDFSSDIIITNIDNFIKPSVSNNYGARSLMIYDCDVIFDEVHEYENMNCALFASYNNIMKQRHNKLDSTTLMLTATEPTFKFKEMGGKNINILPNKKEHFKAAHDQKYRIFFHEDIPIDLMEGEFVSFHHTVDDVQNHYINYDGPKLISHGRYLDEDKLHRKQLVLDNYNKNGQRKKLGVFTNQILTTSCDYSVKKIFIKAPSVKIFQQSIGRLNRWGNMGECDIHISINKTRADATVIGGKINSLENTYQNLFIQELKEQFENQKFTLNEMYIFLNNFNHNNRDLREQISYANLIESQTMLKNIFPKKFKGKNEVKIANGNKLRRSLSSDEMYILVKTKDKKNLVTIGMNLSNNTKISHKFNEDQNTYKKQLKVLKDNQGYNKYKTLDPNTLLEESVFYDKPYPVFNYLYDYEIGLYKIQ
jgi:CRISPR-associated endonuclease Cas3-HD